MTAPNIGNVSLFLLNLYLNLCSNPPATTTPRLLDTKFVTGTEVLTVIGLHTCVRQLLIFIRIHLSLWNLQGSKMASLWWPFRSLVVVGMRRSLGLLTGLIGVYEKSSSELLSGAAYSFVTLSGKCVWNKYFFI